MISWTVSFLALIGVILNVKKDRRCFVIWSFTNAFWMIYDWRLGAKAQSALFFVYFVLAIWGLLQWSKTKERG